MKTAFFKLSSINQQITELQARQRELETKVNNGRLSLPVDTLMVPFYAKIITTVGGRTTPGDDSATTIPSRSSTSTQPIRARA